MSIKFEIPQNDTIALAEIGQALVNIATRQKERDAAIASNILANQATNMLRDLKPEPEHVEAVTPEHVEVVTPEPIPLSYFVNDATKGFEETDVELDIEGLLNNGYREVTEQEYNGFIKLTQEESTIDSAGLPWDARIHAGSKAKIADGTWKYRRKSPELSDDEWKNEIETVEAELNKLMSIPVAPPVPSIPAVPVAPPVPAPSNDRAFPEMMTLLVERMGEEGFTNKAQQAAIDLGLTGIQDLKTRTDLIPQYLQSLGM